MARRWTSDNAGGLHQIETSAPVEAIYVKVDAAPAANVAYLATASPGTSAAKITRLEVQVEKLTRQITALERLALGQDDPAGT